MKYFTVIKNNGVTYDPVEILNEFKSYKRLDSKGRKFLFNECWDQWLKDKNFVITVIIGLKRLPREQLTKIVSINPELIEYLI